MKKTATTKTGQSLTSMAFEEPPIHVPDEKGGAYKTELAVLKSPEKTIKYIWWHGGDPRSTPHNHPWEFTSTILSGGYTEDRYKVVGGKVEKETITHVAGGENHVPSDVFHVVYDVLKGTSTRLVCGQASEGNSWGYLDVNTGDYTEAEKDPAFFEKLKAINPHMGMK